MPVITQPRFVWSMISAFVLRMGRCRMMALTILFFSSGIAQTAYAETKLCAIRVESAAGAIILIHGLWGDPNSSFLHYVNGVYWPDLMRRDTRPLGRAQPLLAYDTRAQNMTRVARRRFRGASRRDSVAEIIRGDGPWQH